jgi:hypothetical protein
MDTPAKDHVIASIMDINSEELFQALGVLISGWKRVDHVNQLSLSVITSQKPSIMFPCPWQRELFERVGRENGQCMLVIGATKEDICVFNMIMTSRKSENVSYVVREVDMDTTVEMMRENARPPVIIVDTYGFKLPDVTADQLFQLYLIGLDKGCESLIMFSKNHPTGTSGFKGMSILRVTPQGALIK